MHSHNHNTTSGEGHNHSHDHGHDHSHGGHHHHHAVTAADVANKAFIFGIILNGAYVVIQVVAGFITHSMALLSDAGHNLSDVASLALSLLAFRLAKAKPTDSFTYGYKKTTILAALTNAVVLLITIGMLGYESVNRLLHPQPVEGGMVAIVAGIGIVINLASAFLFFRNKEHDLNTKGAYLHLLTDAMVSLGVVVSGLIISFTKWYWLDGAVSITVLIVILFGTWSLLTQSLRLSMDAVPEGVNVESIEKVINKIKGVESIHHMHIWAMSTTENALTTHLVLNEQLSFDEKMKLVHKIKHELQHNKIHHATIELESADIPCEDVDC
jgi:cobalt-zinc-cadmium efflux system protein